MSPKPGWLVVCLVSAFVSVCLFLVALIFVFVSGCALFYGVRRGGGVVLRIFVGSGIRDEGLGIRD